MSRDNEHAPDAVSIPMALVRERQAQLPRDRRIVVMCRFGRTLRGRHGIAARVGVRRREPLRRHVRMAAAGLPVVTPADGGLVMHRAEPLNCETSIPALIGGVVMPNARFYVRNHFAAQH